MVLNLLDNIELSEDKPADKLIEEEKRKEAFKIIEDFENDAENIEKLLSLSDRSLCQQFVEEFMNCADYDQLCDEEELKEFWPSVYNRL